MFISNMFKIWLKINWFWWEKRWRFLQIFIGSSPWCFSKRSRMFLTSRWRKNIFVQNSGLCPAGAQLQRRRIIPSVSYLEKRRRTSEQIVEAVATDDYTAEEGQEYLDRGHFSTCLTTEHSNNLLHDLVTTSHRQSPTGWSWSLISPCQARLVDGPSQSLPLSLRPVCVGWK